MAIKEQRRLPMLLRMKMAVRRRAAFAYAAAAAAAAAIAAVAAEHDGTYVSWGTIFWETGAGVKNVKPRSSYCLFAASASLQAGNGHGRRNFAHSVGQVKRFKIWGTSIVQIIRNKNNYQ